MGVVIDKGSYQFREVLLHDPCLDLQRSFGFPLGISAGLLYVYIDFDFHFVFI